MELKMRTPAGHPLSKLVGQLTQYLDEDQFAAVVDNLNQLDDMFATKPLKQVHFQLEPDFYGTERYLFFRFLSNPDSMARPNSVPLAPMSKIQEIAGEPCKATRRVLLEQAVGEDVSSMLLLGLGYASLFNCMMDGLANGDIAPHGAVTINREAVVPVQMVSGLLEDILAKLERGEVCFS